MYSNYDQKIKGISVVNRASYQWVKAIHTGTGNVLHDTSTSSTECINQKPPPPQTNAQPGRGSSSVVSQAVISSYSTKWKHVLSFITEIFQSKDNVPLDSHKRERLIKSFLIKHFCFTKILSETRGWYKFSRSGNKWFVSFCYFVVWVVCTDR